MKLTPEDIDRISIMRDDGKTTEQIAEAFRVTYGSMAHQIDRLIKAGEIGKLYQPTHWTDKKIDDLIVMKDAGATVEEMSARLGVTYYAMQNKIKCLIRGGQLPREYARWKENKPYEYLDARNLCHSCGYREKFPGRQFCPDCLSSYALSAARRPLTAEQRRKKCDYLLRQRDERKANGLCTICGKTATHGLYCYEHMIARKRIAAQNYRDRKAAAEDKPTLWDIRKANHLCLRCGKPIEDGNDTFWCGICRERQSRISTALNARMKAEGKIFRYGRNVYGSKTHNRKPERTQL